MNKDIKDIIEGVKSGATSSAKDAIGRIMKQNAAVALREMRIQVAKTLFNKSK